MVKRKGFTLIELVMVIVIIGILAAIAIPRFINLRKDASMAACKGTGGGLRAALSTFYASTAIRTNTARFPANIASLQNYMQTWPAKSPAAYGQASASKDSWQENYTSSSGVLNVEAACSW